MEEVKAFFLNPSIYISIVIAIIALYLLKWVKKNLIKKSVYTNKEEKKANTLSGVLYSVLQYLIVIVAIIIIMKVNGLNVTAILAGLSIAATIVGLSLQDFLKDIIKGISIYTNNFYKVGDVVEYEGQICEVKYFSATVTKLRTFIGNDTITLSNSLITSIKKIKQDNFSTWTFEYYEDQDKIDQAFKNCIDDIDAIHGVNTVNYIGVISINEKGVTYAITYRCDPRKQMAFNGEIHRILYSELKKINIMPARDNEYYINERFKKETK